MYKSLCMLSPLLMCRLPCDHQETKAQPRPKYISYALSLKLQWFALLLTYPYRHCALLAENVSCASVSMPVVLRFNCTANHYRCNLAHHG